MQSTTTPLTPSVPSENNAAQATIPGLDRAALAKNAIGQVWECLHGSGHYAITQIEDDCEYLTLTGTHGSHYELGFRNLCTHYVRRGRIPGRITRVSVAVSLYGEGPIDHQECWAYDGDPVAALREHADLLPTTLDARIDHADHLRDATREGVS